MSLGAYWKDGSVGGYWTPEFWTAGYWYEGDGTVTYDSVYWRILTAVQVALQGMSLPHIQPLSLLPAGRVHLEKVPQWRDKQPYPVIIVYPPKGESVGGVVNARDDITYAVGILFVYADEQQQADNYQLEMRWRQMIRRRFNQKRIDTVNVPEQFNCENDSNTVFDTAAFHVQGLSVSRLGFVFTTREVRDHSA